MGHKGGGYVAPLGTRGHTKLTNKVSLSASKHIKRACVHEPCNRLGILGTLVSIVPYAQPGLFMHLQYESEHGKHGKHGLIMQLGGYIWSIWSVGYAGS